MWGGSFCHIAVSDSVFLGAPCGCGSWAFSKQKSRGGTGPGWSRPWGSGQGPWAPLHAVLSPASLVQRVPMGAVWSGSHPTIPLLCPLGCVLCHGKTLSATRRTGTTWLHQALPWAQGGRGQGAGRAVGEWSVLVPAPKAPAGSRDSVRGCGPVPVPAADMHSLLRFQNFKRSTERDSWPSIEKR